MTIWQCTMCSTTMDQEEQPEQCSSCGADNRVILDKETVPQTLEAVRDRARKNLKGVCAAYPACDGNFDKICQKEAYGKPIGFGGAGAGFSFRANVACLETLRLKLRVVGEHTEPDTSCTFLDTTLDFPVMAASTAGAERYNNAISEEDFCRAVIRGCRDAGTIGWRGDTFFYTPDDNPALSAIKKEGVPAVPIFKPRSQDVLKRLFIMAEELGCPALGVDLDGCGSTIMARHKQAVFRKSVKDIKELVRATSLPFIAKGIMTVEDALSCADAGVKVVGVSNHGGRVLDATPGVAEVLPDIAKQLKGQVTITADGGVRTGYDVLKMLALGADFVLLGRDVIRAALGAGSLGVGIHMEHVRKILKKAMFMTGVSTIAEIDSSILC
ncbi:alpha-hydroxy-acid oxidizing protein [Desulfobacter latus]|uniref:Alpha-hydroxy-acid oxidizing protein n=1 Tax=Desulfobacter latus TaxID=2292 RepID=A0A850T8H5_9BACT|nr:alpha-hydroxy-acid oxidizing protein [Desulfobacter latus]NWH04748.1 alpha-hydroxy-acid oxidizing protein [Desulfobacter latus]